MNEEWIPVRRHCPNCGREITGARNGKGVVRMQCGVCGLVLVGKRMSRRHERCDLYAPAEDDRQLKTDHDVPGRG